MEPQIKKLSEAIKAVISILDMDTAKMLVESFNELVTEYNKLINPKEKWLADEQFAEIMGLWIEATGKTLNEPQKLAIIKELRQLTGDNLQLAIFVLMLSAQHKTSKFELNLDQAREKIKLVSIPPKPQSAPAPAQGDKARTLEQILAGVDYSLTDNVITLQTAFNPALTAQLKLYDKTLKIKYAR